MSHFYAVVYGAEWEDIVYYNDFNKARTKLIVQTLPQEGFHPLILEYTLDDEGVYHRTKYVMSVLDVEALRSLDPEEIRRDPTIAYDLIGYVW
jgi:hypothetical protein